MNNHIYPGRDKCIIYLQVLLIHPLSMINSGKDLLFYLQLRKSRKWFKKTQQNTENTVFDSQSTMFKYNTNQKVF